MLTKLGPGALPQIPQTKPLYTSGEQTARTTPVPQRNYDSIELSPAPEGEQRQFMDLVSRIAKETRTATTIGDIQTLRAQVSSGEYQPDAMNIAAKMLLMEDV